MPIPRYDELQVPILKNLDDREPKKAKDLVSILAPIFDLTDEEKERIYDSGNGRIFIDRIQWALSYLNMAGLVKKPKIGTFLISDDGKKLLKTPEKVTEYIAEKINNRVATKRNKKKEEIESIVATALTPEESMFNSFEGIRTSINREIIDTILSKSPRSFEKLVVELLQKMGYGGEIEDSGIVTQYANDKGIDGIIKEDILGFGKINIQAKRYAIDNKVPREDIQKFVGALAVAQSDKGVFITTSDFSKGAYEYVKSLNSSTKVILINGETLANHIYEFNLGMQTEKIIEIKKLDSDYWDNMPDDES